MTEWFSSLNYLRAFSSEIHRALILSLSGGSFQRYASILFSTLCAAYGDDILCEVVSSNPLLERPIKTCKRFLQAMNKLSGRGLAISGASILYAIEKAENILKTYGKKPFIILCDCFSLPEYIYLYDKFRDKTRPDKLLYAINPGGKTRTFEHLAKTYLFISSEEVTLNMLAEALKTRLGAAGYLLYREIDAFVHGTGQAGFPNLMDIAFSLYRLVEELALKVEQLLDRYCILIMSDHGYDIYSKDDKWYLTHRFNYGRHNLSIFSAAILIG